MRRPPPLFQDVYDWAGQVRTVRISKRGNPFCFPEQIEAQAAKLFGELKAANGYTGLSASQFATQAAHFLAELNAIHPFREGNGRAQLTFLGLLAAAAGHPARFSGLDPDAMLKAMVASFDGDESDLARIVLDLIR